MFLAITNKIKTFELKKSGSTVFMLSAMLVNAGNYFYNLWLGRYVGPEVFAETGLMVTCLLVLSFLGMTFQIVTAKYIVEIPETLKDNFKKLASLTSLFLGIGIAAVIFINDLAIQQFLNLSSVNLVNIFAISIPFYFHMSVKRGFLQGKTAFFKLSGSYQAEMISRFLFTFILLFGLNVNPSISVATSLTLSIIFGSAVMGSLKGIKHLKFKLPKKYLNPILTFFAFTAAYEVVQMLINYFDIVLVKHFFDNTLAGYYTSLSLIGRMIYFVTWMFVMLLLPEVINKRKNGEPYQQLLNKYLLYIGLFITVAVLGSYLFGDMIVHAVFGPAYAFISAYLWKYALATGLFALANVYVYYYLSLDNYKPVAFTGLMAVVQITALCLFHDSFAQIINIQIVCMAIGLGLQVIYSKQQKQLNDRKSNSTGISYQ